MAGACDPADRVTGCRGRNASGDCELYLPWYIVNRVMRYADSEKRRLTNRLSRIRGQIEAIQAALADDASCTALLPAGNSLPRRHG